MPIPDSDLPDGGAAFQLRTEDTVEALARSNPGAARGVVERTGRILMLISKAVLNDADAIRRAAGLDEAGALDVVHEIASGLDGRSGGAARAFALDGPERIQGTGLGEVVGREAGLARLADRSSAMHLEDWAGPVAEAGEILAREGVTPETLDGWRRSRTVVEPADRDGRSVYPSRQFLGRRPVPGLAEVQAIVGDPRSAWLWLVEPNRDGSPSWLDLLRRERTAEVLEAARQDFR